MNPEQQQAILAIPLFAVFTGGVKDEREREEIWRIAAMLDAGQIMAMVHGNQGSMV